MPFLGALVGRYGIPRCNVAITPSMARRFHSMMLSTVYTNGHQSRTSINNESATRFTLATGNARDRAAGPDGSRSLVCRICFAILIPRAQARRSRV